MKKPKCDKDCFNCKFDDCVASQEHILSAGNITENKPKKRERKPKCDNDCFNCKYDDCILTEKEAARNEFIEVSYTDPATKKHTRTPKQEQAHQKYLKHREYYLNKAKEHYRNNVEYYREYEKAYREKKTKEDPEYFTKKFKKVYYKTKSDPAKWEEYQRKQKEYYERKKKEKQDGKVI